MTCSLSMTGVTILTKSKYKVRHAGPSEIVQIPRAGFIMRSADPYKKKRPPKKRRSVRKTNCPEHDGKKQVAKVPNYRIDKKEVQHRIRGFVNQMKGEKMLYFWSITFPPNTSDDVCYILLNKWLTRLRQEKMLREYLWIAERQEGDRLQDKTKEPTHTLHFHMVINQKMNVHTANKYMRASIMHSINAGEIQYDRTKAMRYNGVDIAKDRKTRRVINFAKAKKQKALTNYLAKYVSKNDSSFTHLAWHSSRGYSNIVTAVRFTWDEYSRSNTENLLDNNEPLICEYFYFRRWKGPPPKDLLMYLGLLNQSIQETLLKN